MFRTAIVINPVKIISLWKQSIKNISSISSINPKYNKCTLQTNLSISKFQLHKNANYSASPLNHKLQERFHYPGRIISLSSMVLKRHLRKNANDNNTRSEASSKDEKPSLRSRWGTLASMGLGASFLFGKTKYFLVALKLTKAAPLASMVLTSFAYSFIFGWPYAVGMVGLILCHECGHAIVMIRYGIPFSPMVFIPFLGAVIAMKDNPRNAYEDAMIAFGGPVAGSIAAGVVGAIGISTGNQLLIALADFGYIINLLNLVPIGNMDGGRIGGAISPWVNVLGLGLGGGVIYMGIINSPILYLMMLFGTYSTVSRFLGWSDGMTASNKNYYKIPRFDQLKIAVAYIALIIVLITAINENNKYRLNPKRLQAKIQQKKNIYDDNNYDPYDYINDRNDDDEEVLEDFMKKMSSWTSGDDNKK